MTKTINLQAAALAVVATMTTLVSVHGVAAYEQRTAVAAAQVLQVPQVLAAAAQPAAQQIVIVGRRIAG